MTKHAWFCQVFEGQPCGCGGDLDTCAGWDPGPCESDAHDFDPDVHAEDIEWLAEEYRDEVETAE